MNQTSPLMPNSRHTRSGATLVEVLMALLIMAIGVTSVFTLFPISIIKAIKAHQLTDAKLYESAIKDTLLTHPQLWTGAPEWSENTWYGRNPPVVPPAIPLSTPPLIQDNWVTPKRSGRLVPDTNQLFYADPNNPLPQVSGSVPPDFQIRNDWQANLSLGGYREFYPQPLTPPVWGTSTPDAGLDWIPYRHSRYLANPLWSAYVVDPLGWHNAATNAERQQFGQIPTGPLPFGDSSGVANTLNMDRIHCQLSLASANAFFRLADTWSMIVEPTPLETSVVGNLPVTIPSAGFVQIDFPNTIDVGGLAPISNFAPVRNRVVLSSTRTNRTVTIPITYDPFNTYPSPGPGVLQIPGSLPAGFDLIADQASIEVEAPSRYSWLMSVHSSPTGQFTAECAVVFNRSLQVADEQGYRAEFMQQFDVDGNGSIGANETNIAKVRWPYNPAVDAPRIKEGGYIFDASFGYWYQIKKVEKVNGETQQRVNAADALDTAGDYVRTILTLNDQVKVSTGASFTDYQIGGGIDCQAVLLPGVIHVFSMTPESPL